MFELVKLLSKFVDLQSHHKSQILPKFTEAVSCNKKLLSHWSQEAADEDMKRLREGYNNLATNHQLLKRDHQKLIGKWLQWRF